MIRNLFAALVALGAATALPAPAAAQTYPNRPIKMIVPFPAGGPIDVMARLLSQRLSSSFGTVIVENRPGGGSTVGLKAVATAEPDGYTFLFGGTMTLSVIPAMSRGPEGDAIRGMAPIALVSSTPFVLIVAPRVPATTVAELVAYAKANPSRGRNPLAGRRTVQDEGRDRHHHHSLSRRRQYDDRHADRADRHGT